MCVKFQVIPFRDFHFILLTHTPTHTHIPTLYYANTHTHIHTHTYPHCTMLTHTPTHPHTYPHCTTMLSALIITGDHVSAMLNYLTLTSVSVTIINLVTSLINVYTKHRNEQLPGAGMVVRYGIVESNVPLNTV